MLYLETKPSLPLAGCIRSLWYTRAPEMRHERERVLPNGCVQVVISLAADSLTDCAPDSEACEDLPHSILVGARGRFEVIHMRDMAELVGIVFRPGGLGPWMRERAVAFFERSVALEDVWGARGLRDRLREEITAERKLARLDALLVAGLRGRETTRRDLVRGAVTELTRRSVRETARMFCVSERRLHQLFLEDVGMAPKLWSRVQRFQRAVRILHGGEEMRWDQLALGCGYFDQSHFSNDFRAFSGIDPTTYSAGRGRWRNHIVYS